MHRRTYAAGIFVLASAVATVACAGGASDRPSEEESQAAEAALATIPKLPHRAICAHTAPGQARCHAHALLNADGSRPHASNTPMSSAKTPSDVQSAYNLGGLTGSATIAIVDAYDDPNAEADLAVYRKQYGLSPCTTDNGCFKKVNQNGEQGNYPSADSGWATEIALDLDAVSAACPACKIILVEASSNYFSDFGTAVDQAVTLGATVVSNSYGGTETQGDSSDESHFNHPGVSIFVSSGDDNYGVEFPASSRYVTAVGGTALTKAAGTTRGWAEKVWGNVNGGKGTGAGSGCSAYTAKPSWQKDLGCSKRTVADISADADPNTGISIYDSYGVGGWAQYGGTSLASPLSAAIYAVSGQAGRDGSFSYSNPSAFWDVTSGANGQCANSDPNGPSTDYLCTGEVGFDGPTGNGTPNGAALAQLK